MFLTLEESASDPRDERETSSFEEKESVSSGVNDTDEGRCWTSSGVGHCGEGTGVEVGEGEEMGRGSFAGFDSRGREVWRGWICMSKKKEDVVDIRGAKQERK